MKRSSLLWATVFVTLLCPIFVNAQFSGLTIGYNIGVFGSAARNFQAGANEFNTIHSDDLKNEIRMRPLYRGLTFGFAMNEESGYFGINWSSKKMLSNYGEYGDEKRKWRFRFNAISLEGAVGWEGFKIGMSTEIGVARASKRVLKSSENKMVGGWEPLYDGKVLIESGYISGASTIFLMFISGERLVFKPYYQFSYGGKAISVDNLTYGYYTHRINNYGFSLLLWLNFD